MNLVAWFDQAQPGQTTEYAMSELPQPRLMVFRKEPLMRAIAAMGVSPVTLGIWFFIFVSLTLSVWATLTEPPPQAGVRYLSFFDNISWSISMIYLFPFVVSLTLKYYLEIPNLFAFLLDQTSQNQGNQTELDAFYAWLDRRFNSYWVTAGALALTIGLNLIYFHEILDQLGDPDWITGGKILGSLSKHGRGFTAVGLYSLRPNRPPILGYQSDLARRSPGMGPPRALQQKEFSGQDSTAPSGSLQRPEQDRRRCNAAESDALPSGNIHLPQGGR
jgi:hypothetical protein